MEWWYVAIFLLEVVNSCIAALRTIWLTRRKKWLAPIADILNEQINYIIGFVVYVETKNLWLALAASIASGVGTRLAMYIKVPKKKKPKGKIPVNI